MVSFPPYCGSVVLWVGVVVGFAVVVGVVVGFVVEVEVVVVVVVVDAVIAVGVAFPQDATTKDSTIKQLTMSNIVFFFIIPPIISVLSSIVVPFIYFDVIETSRLVSYS